MKIDGDVVWGAAIGTIACSPFLMFGVWSIFFSKSLTVLECQRLEPYQVRCQLTTKGLLNSETSQISNLKKAKLSTDMDSNRDRYHVVLITDRRNKVFSNVSKSNDRAKKLVNIINSFVNNPQQYTLTMRDDNRWYAYLRGSVPIVICTYLVFACCKNCYEQNQSRNL